MGKISIYIYQIVFVVFILIDLFLWKNIICTAKWLKVLLYFRFIILFIISIYSIIYPIFALNIKGRFIANHTTLCVITKKIFRSAYLILNLLSLIYGIFNFFNDNNLREFYKNCPFTFNSILKNESLYERRRCELYDMNMNSRYKFQYICSYNASESFKGDKTKDGYDKLVCIPKMNNINENKIIYKFNEIYDNKEINHTNLFYCSRIDMPEKNEYINEEYCNMENKYKSLITWIIFLFDLLKIYVPTLIDELD